MLDLVGSLWGTDGCRFLLALWEAQFFFPVLMYLDVVMVVVGSYSDHSFFSP